MWRMTWNSSQMPLPPCMSRARRAISSALPHCCASPWRPSRATSCLRRSAGRRAGTPAGRARSRSSCRRASTVKLLGGERHAELLPVEAVLARGVPCSIRPHPACPMRCRSARGSGSRTDLSGPVPGSSGSRRPRLVHHDLAGVLARSESLPSIFGAERPFIPLSSTKPRMDAAVALGPDHEDVGEGRVGDPGLGAREPSSPSCFGVGLHAAGRSPHRARSGRSSRSARRRRGRGDTSSSALSAPKAVMGTSRARLHRAIER